MPLQNVARVFFYATETPHVLSVQYLLNNSSETPALNAGLDQDEAPPTTTPPAAHAKYVPDYQHDLARNAH